MLGSVRHSLSHEDKQQAAIEATQDPESSVTAEQAQKIVKDQAKAAGAQAFSFDPNASPDEKAAQARAVSASPTLLPARPTDMCRTSHSTFRITGATRSRH